jgi:hypothetical protein
MRPVWLGVEEVVGRGRHRWQEDMSQVTWTKWKKGTKNVDDFSENGVNVMSEVTDIPKATEHYYCLSQIVDE